MSGMSSGIPEYIIISIGIQEHYSYCNMNKQFIISHFELYWSSSLRVRGIWTIKSKPRKVFALTVGIATVPLWVHRAQIDSTIDYDRLEGYDLEAEQGFAKVYNMAVNTFWDEYHWSFFYLIGLIKDVRQLTRSLYFVRADASTLTKRRLTRRTLDNEKLTANTR